MAKSHITHRNGKTLGGIFLGSVMALGGTACTAPDDDSAPDHHDHNHMSLIPEEAIITNAESRIARTDEEDMNNPIRFSDIPTKGDARAKRLIAALRSTPMGQELYQYAVDQNSTFMWEDDDDRRAGAFFTDKNRVTVDARTTEDGALMTLTHEIRHSWQFRTLGVDSWILDPKDRWAASRLIETDSCATTVHFVADYQKRTGKVLDAKHNYNRRVIEAYLQKPEDQRDYITDAVEPCFRKVEAFYNDLHVENARYYLDRMETAYKKSGDDDSRRKRRRIFESAFDTPDREEKAAMFRSFFTLSVTPNAAPVPWVQNAKTDDFLTWVTTQTPRTRPEDEATINRLQDRFNVMHGNLTGRRQAARTPFPAP